MSVRLGVLRRSPIFGVIRGGERPKPAFWAFSLLGSALVSGFALSQGLDASPVGDALMLGAVVLAELPSKKQAAA